MEKNPQTLLKNVFGYDEFRPLQHEIIDRTLAGNDSFVLMPTGGGKSMCFQIPALCFDGITLVVSPLISLMKDQVQALQSNGIKAAFFNSSISPCSHGFSGLAMTIAAVFWGTCLCSIRFNG